jgi:hypothetical protein
MLPDGGCACGGTEDLIQCVDCFTVRVSCRPCCLKAHRMLPFHRIKRWNGNFFARSSLFSQGHIIHLGHEGGPCPKHEDCLKATGEDEFVEGLDLLSQEEGDGKNLESEENWFSEDTSERVVTIVHTTGVFQHRVHWCSCLGHEEEHIQLLRLRLFPASTNRPSTAFSFDVLDHFYVIAMECKTSAQSFSQKLRRLTNNVFPHMVPVSSEFNCNILTSIDDTARTVTGNFYEYPGSGVTCMLGKDLALDMRKTRVLGLGT